MAVEKIIRDSQGGVIEETFYDHADDMVAITQRQDDAPVREYVSQKRLAGAKYVEGLGYEIATLPIALCDAYGVERGLPRNWYYKDGYNDEMKKLIALASAFNPWGKQ